LLQLKKLPSYKILTDRNLYIILASGEIKGIGYWLIDTTFSENPLHENKELLECHRKELIGEKSSKDIIYAINFNLTNLLNEIIEEGFYFEKPLKGISYSLPLNEIEKIFDFWIETYKNKTSWETCLGLLKIKKRLSLRSLLVDKGIKGNARAWAPKIEELHGFRPFSKRKIKRNEPMWK